MTDQNSPFAAPPVFQPQPGPLLPHMQPVVQGQGQVGSKLPADVPPAGKKGRRGPRKPVAAVEGAPPPPAGKKRGPKPKTASAPARAASTVRLDLAVAIDALVGLSADEAKLFQSLVVALQPFKSAERERILAALGKVFAQ